jgi:hypothetical protein
MSKVARSFPRLEIIQIPLSSRSPAETFEKYCDINHEHKLVQMSHLISFLAI